ncbi:RDD family protein [Aquimarina aggregata]|uniref:RDD family protein n=1 Tax=Aquimarina aggregata TaxID=1642818 RepID=UPI0024927968|nr:RDD family protein [Aquimarina aggregata]
MKITNEKYKNLKLAIEEERAENFIIDFILSSVLGLIVSFLTFQNLVFAFFVYTILRFLYYFCFELLLGRTPGKYQTQTKVVRMNNKKPTITQLIIRNSSRFVSIFSGVSDHERAIHDNLSGTFVIKDKTLKKIDFKRPITILFYFSLVGFSIYIIGTQPELNTFDIILVITLSLIFISSLYLLFKNGKL